MSVQNGADNGSEVPFSWGKKGGRSPDKKTQFYESFTYDGVEYHKYDSVFVSNSPELAPHIGKIIKIWEQDDGKAKKVVKRVKILWFFRPTEISAYLENITLFENEIFLASGEGEGLFNVNPLDVVAGKVNVICTSLDERNPQPSAEDLKLADYIFYRTFDVGSMKISDKIDDTIAGVEAKFLLNGMDLKHQDESEKAEDPETDKSNGIPLNKLKILADEKNGRPAIREGESSGVKVKLEKSGKVDTEDTGKPSDKPSTKLKLSGDSQRVAADGVNVKREVQQIESSCDAQNIKLDKQRGDSSGVKFKSGMQDGKISSTDDQNVKFDKQRRDSDGAKLKPGMQDTKISSDAKNVKLDKQKGDSDSAKLKPGVWDTNISVDVQKISSGTKGIDSNGLGKGISRNPSINEKQAKPYDGPKKASPDLLSHKDKGDLDVVEVTRRPELERSKWFKDLPWNQRIEVAYDEDKLVMLDNLDPDYSKADVEDILYHAFNQHLTVRLIEQSSFTNPNYGQALVLCKTSDLADMVVRKLNSEFLLLPNGRPLLASKGITRSPKKKSYSLIGGPLSMDKYTKMRKIKEEARGAAAASHYSQHNTIEYEMAMEWMFHDHKSSCWWEELHKVQQREIKQMTTHLKTK